MRVLQINKFLWEFGGSERVMLETSRLLEAHGHEVEFFGMQHGRNFPSKNESFFLPNIDYRNGSRLYKLRNGVRAVERTIYSPGARRRMEMLLDVNAYDIAHVHMIEHQISPSVLVALKKAGMPVVQTCHDHKLVCPESHLYCEPRGEVCERCVDDKSYYHLAMRRCMRGSLAVSGLAAIAHYVHRFSKVYERNVDLFIAPSGFLAERLVRGGIPERKIRILANALDVGEYVPERAGGNYVLYFGRLSKEKGVGTLLDAARWTGGVPVKIAGEGPELDTLRNKAKADGLRNVEFVGYQEAGRLKETIQGARFVVVPSECYENCPMSILEAYAMAKPVVATRMGGIPENVDEGVTGVLVEAGNGRALATALKTLFEDPEKCQVMGAAGRLWVERISAKYYERLVAIYEEARVLSKNVNQDMGNGWAE